MALSHLQQECQPAVPVWNMPGSVGGLGATIHAPAAALCLYQLGDDSAQRGQGLVDVAGLFEVLSLRLAAAMLTAMDAFTACKTQHLGEHRCEIKC